MEVLAKQYIVSLSSKHCAKNENVEKMDQNWYCIAACAFAAANQGRFVADVYSAAIAAHCDNLTEQRRILQRTKESQLKTGMIYGIPRLISAFRHLIKALPSPASNEISSSRSHIQVPSKTDERGMAYMRNIFQADLDPFLNLMDENWPDLRILVVTFIYGHYQSDLSVIDAITTSQLNLATLVPMDVPTEVAWHMRGLVRNSGTLAQLQAATDIALDVCRICEVQLKGTLPVPEEIIDEQRLF